MSVDDQSGNEPDGARVVLVRPPHGLSRGKYPVPAWALLTLGAVIVLVGLVWLVYRGRQTRKR